MNDGIYKDQGRSLEDFFIWAAYQGGEPDIRLLTELVGDCIKMTVQKSSGQQKGSPKSHLNWENWERVRMSILAEAIKLARSGLLDDLADEGRSESLATVEEYPTWDFLFKKNNWDYQKAGSVFNYLKPHNIEADEADIAALKESVGRLAMIPSRDWRTEYNPEREMLKNSILCEAAALVLSGVLGNCACKGNEFDGQKESDSQVKIPDVWEFENR